MSSYLHGSDRTTTGRSHRPRPRAVVAASLAAVLAGGGLLALDVAVHRDRCSPLESFSVTDGRGAPLVPVEDLATSVDLSVPGTTGAGVESTIANGATEEIAAAGELGAPFGDLVLGFATSDHPVRVIALGGDRIALAAGAGTPGSTIASTLRAFSLPGTEPKWAHESVAYASGGGRVDDAFVSLGITRGKAPEVRSYDLEDGTSLGYVVLGSDHETGWDPALVTDAVGGNAGDDVVVAYEDEGYQLTRVSPSSSEVLWTRALIDASFKPRDVAVVGDVAIVGNVDMGGTDIGLAIDWALAEEGAPAVRAYSTVDGHERWQFPAEQSDPAVVARVLTMNEEEGVVLLETAQQLDDPELADAVVHELVALDLDGTELWRTPLTERYAQVARWGSTVVLDDPSNGILRGLNIADGTERWTRQHRLSAEGVSASVEVSSSVAVGDRWIVPDGLGYLYLDPLTGEGDGVDLTERLQRVTATDHYLVLEWWAGILVFERSDSPPA